MYQVEDDCVVPMGQCPQPDAGAPLPAVVSDEISLALSYIISEPDPEWDGSYVNVVSRQSDDKRVALIVFQSPLCHFFGPPNDEAFSGHPLATRGLRPYLVCEIANSSWIRSLERMNAVHPFHSPDAYSGYRHFIFAFHDSTFECVAKGFTIEVCGCSIASAIRLMANRIGEESA